MKMKQILSRVLFVSLLGAGSVSLVGAEIHAAEAKKKDASGGRKKFLSQEGRTKGNSKTNIDFEAASIDGERRIPAGVAIGGAKQDNEYDLINLRLRWHPEMVKSTSNLETGKGQ